MKKWNFWTILIAINIYAITVGSLGHALETARAQATPPTLTATWISTNTARIAWSTGGCVDRQRGQARTRVACTDSADERDADAVAGDVFILEYNDSVHGRGEIDTTLAALCGAFVPIVTK